MDSFELSKTKCGLYASLFSPKMRRRHSLFIAEGEKSVRDLMNTFEAEAILLSSGSHLRISAPGAVTYRASDADMRRVSGLTTPSEVIGVFRIPQQADNEVNVDPDRLYLMLDGVRDPGNLGTIIRTCHWFGIFDIFASRDTADCFNPKVVQATMGSLGHVRITYCDLDKILDGHPEMPVYGLLLDGKNIYDSSLSRRGFVVMGNEGKGLSESIRKRVTSPLLIPPATSDHGESLNVSCATAITLALFTKP